MLHKVVGLDISTSCIGIAVLGKGDDSDEHEIILLDHVDLKCQKFESLWQKADFAKKEIDRVLSKFNDGTVLTLAIEDPAKKFTAGMSSADTIALLLRFNGLVSLFSRNALSLDPVYISAMEARKLCGLKMRSKSNASGKTHKEQTFDILAITDLSHVDWPKKMRSNKNVDWAYDVCDAYVVAKAALRSL